MAEPTEPEVAERLVALAHGRSRVIRAVRPSTSYRIVVRGM